MVAARIRAERLRAVFPSESAEAFAPGVGVADAVERTLVRALVLFTGRPVRGGLAFAVTIGVAVSSIGTIFRAFQLRRAVDPAEPVCALARVVFIAEAIARTDFAVVVTTSRAQVLDSCAHRFERNARLLKVAALQ